MKLKSRRAVLFTAIAFASWTPSVQAEVAGSHAYTFPENDNKLIEYQRQPGDPARPGRVKIEFYGHMAFKITSPNGISVLLDPWRNDPTGAWGLWFPHEFPEIPVDITVSTHAHFDHDAVDRPHALMVLERLVGEFRLNDMKITGLADKHQCHSDGEQKWDHIATEFGISICPPNNILAFDNTIQIVETGGLRIADWGDNRPVPSPDLEKRLMGVDVLILPIDDSEHILTYKQADEIIRKYHPKIVIPAHYLVAGAESVLSGLQSADRWVRTQTNVHMMTGPELDLSPTDLTGPTGRVYYFANYYRNK